jgi:hypothetical protein
MKPGLRNSFMKKLGGVLMIFGGTGSEFRQPLGYAIVGGVIVS